MYNFYCVGGEKYGCTAFSNGSNGKIVTVDEALIDTSLPLCWAGSHKETLYNHCKSNNRTFYNLDSGYFGNTKRKNVIRVSLNNFQDCQSIVETKNNRLDLFNINLEEFVRGSQIVIVPPDYKIAKSFNLGDNWLDNVKQTINKFTDRPIKVRNRPESRNDRLKVDTFKEFIRNDTYVVIGYSSNALVEAVMCGIPVIALGHSSTLSYSNYNISQIDNIPNVDTDKRHLWLKHLANRQFFHEELLDGTAWKILTESSGVWSRT